MTPAGPHSDGPAVTLKNISSRHDCLIICDSNFRVLQSPISLLCQTVDAGKHQGLYGKGDQECLLTGGGSVCGQVFGVTNVSKETIKASVEGSYAGY